MAKTYRNLYHQIYNPLNLWAAYKKAAKGKRYKPPAASFEYELERNLLEIEAELRSESYQPSGYHSFTIQRPKRRLINAAPFRDRVVHHALMNIIEPFLNANSFLILMPTELARAHIKPSTAQLISCVVIAM